MKLLPHETECAAEHEVMVENILWARVQLGILPKDNLRASYYLDLEPRRNKGVYLYGT